MTERDPEITDCPYCGAEVYECDVFQCGECDTEICDACCHGDYCDDCAPKEDETND